MMEILRLWKVVQEVGDSLSLKKAEEAC